jgi:putative transposase
MRMTATIKATRTRERRPDDPPWAGWPRFHHWTTQWASLEYHALTGGFTLNGRTLTLSFGKGDDGTQQRVAVTLAQRLPPFARPATFNTSVKATHPIRGLRITKEHGVYYAVLTVRRSVVMPKALPDAPRIVSLDPHHYSLAMAVDTDGVATRIPYPPGARALGRRIDQLKARRDRCVRERLVDERGVVRYRESKRYRQFDALIKETERRREARITHYLYDVANWLCRHYDVVAIGDYSPTGPAHEVAAVNRWVRNESLVGRLRQTCSWMTRRSGRLYLTWPEAGTTRTCADCGHVWPEGIPTRLRYYVCPGCQRRQRRNENNARNGLAIAREQLNTTNPLPASGRRTVLVTVRRTYRCAGLAKAGTGAGREASN